MMRRNHQLAHAIDSASSLKKCLQQFVLQKNSHSNQTKQQTTLGNCCMAGVRLHQFKIAAGAHFHQFHCTKYMETETENKNFRSAAAAATRVPYKACKSHLDNNLFTSRELCWITKPAR
jgi:hypothetical protein